MYASSELIIGVIDYYINIYKQKYDEEYKEKNRVNTYYLLKNFQIQSYFPIIYMNNYIIYQILNIRYTKNKINSNQN